MMVRKSMMKRMGNLLVVFLLAGVFLCASLPVSAKTYNTKNNLLTDDMDFWTTNSMFADLFTREGDTFHLLRSDISEWYGLMEVQHMTRDFTVCGEVEIDGSRERPWNGPRFIIGYYDDTHYNIINFCWDGNVQVVSRDPEAGWVTHKQASMGFPLQAGSHFTFEIDRENRDITVEVNDKVVVMYTLPEEFDYMIPAYETNIGIYNSETDFRVKHFAVYDDNAQLPTPRPTLAPTPEPTPEPTPQPSDAPFSSQTPETTQAQPPLETPEGSAVPALPTETPDLTTPIPAPTEEGGDWILPIAVVVILLAVAGAFVLLLVAKKRKA